MYKLVCIDLDGTLLDDSKILSEKNITAIKAASKIGVYTVITTGRPFDGFYKYIVELGLNNEFNYSIAFNSGIIYKNNKEVIHQNCIKGSDLHKIYDLSLSLNVNIHAFDLNGVIAPKISKYTLHEATINKIPYRLTDFKNISSSESIIKVMLVDEPNVLEEAIKKIPKYFYDEYNIVRSAPFFLEFLKKDVDKIAGVNYLANLLNIKKSEIITIGDAGNDYKMIKECELGVAMKNSMSFVKDVAKYVTVNDNNNSGVAEVFNKFILKK